MNPVKETKHHSKDHHHRAVLLVLCISILVLYPLILSNVDKSPVTSATTTIGLLGLEGNDLVEEEWNDVLEDSDAMTGSSTSNSDRSEIYSTKEEDEDPSKRTSCHFEDAKGHYEVKHGTWSWNWIHNASAFSTGKNCTISNQISAFLQNQYHPKKPLHIIMLGDSFDRNLLFHYLCGPWGELSKQHGFVLFPARQAKHDAPPNDMKENLYNKARLSRETSGLCTNEKFSFAYLHIFGMHHCCPNSNALGAEDSRRFNSTKERVETLLDFEILSRLPQNTTTSNVVVMVSSALWDLSAGCNNQLGISHEYRQLYTMGMLDLYAVIRKLLPNAPIYWRTSPAVSKEYDKKNTFFGHGRTRSNQEELNGIMRKTVAEHNLGVVVDWWVLANQRPETERGVKQDGRHYNHNASIVFYNLFLNALFDHHPYLVQP